MEGIFGNWEVNRPVKEGQPSTEDGSQQIKLRKTVVDIWDFVKEYVFLGELVVIIPDEVQKETAKEKISKRPPRMTCSFL